MSQVPAPSMHDVNLQFIFIAFLTFIIAGCVRGIVGIGFTMLAMGLLSLFASPAQAAALLIIPALVTNVWQFVAGPHCLPLMRRMWLMLLSICTVTWTAAGLITRSGATHAGAALGGALVVYSIMGIAKVRISVSRRGEVWLSPIVGALTGVVTGSTGVQVIPVGPYLQALGLEKDALVQALGLCFTASTLALAVGLGSRGAYHVSAAGISIVCVVPALAGMSLGKWIRGRTDPETFRQLFLIGLLFLGCGLILRAIIP